MDSQTLFSSSRCYICQDISEFEALELALLAAIINNGGIAPPAPPEAQFIITDAADFVVTDAADFIVTG